MAERPIRRVQLAEAPACFWGHHHDCPGHGQIGRLRYDCNCQCHASAS